MARIILYFVFQRRETSYVTLQKENKGAENVVIRVASQGVCFVRISYVPELSPAWLRECIGCVPRGLLGVCHTETRPNLPHRPESEPVGQRRTIHTHFRRPRIPEMHGIS